MEPLITDTVGAKAERCVLNTPLTPQQIQQSQLDAARIAMNAYFIETTQDDDDITSTVTADEAIQESNQDSKQPDQRKNPQARGRLKPTRKGNTEETIE